MNAIRDGTKLRIYGAYLIRDSLKEITGRFYDPDDKAWIIPFTQENAATLALLGVELEDGIIEQQTTEQTVNETPILPMPIKVTPYQHQVRAYNFALRMFGLGGSA